MKAAPENRNQRNTPCCPHHHIGLALGSGSARGWAHIGIIRALADMGMQPDIVTGSSIGALVGAAYASNNLDVFETWVRSLNWKKILSFLDLSLTGGGLIQGDKVFAYIHQQMQDSTIESLPIRFGAVSTDLNSGREVWFQEGSLLDAVRASAALPGLFMPAKVNDRWLVDGGLVDPVPVSLCRAMGAEKVIAVNLNGRIVGRHSSSSQQKEGKEEQRSRSALWERVSNQMKSSLGDSRTNRLLQLFGSSRYAPGMFEVIAGSINIMQDRITRSRMAGDPPELMLSPRLSHLGLMDFDQAAISIDEGYACVQRMQAALEEVLT